MSVMSFFRMGQNGSGCPIRFIPHIPSFLIRFLPSDMPLTESAFHESTRCNSTPGSGWGTDGATPNRRLNSWAENRNLSIDTDSIIAYCDERDRAKRRRLEEQRRNAERKSEKGDEDSRSTQSGQKKVVFGCFSFLPICRRRL
jgi:hypothetical protein